MERVRHRTLRPRALSPAARCRRGGRPEDRRAVLHREHGAVQGVWRAAAQRGPAGQWRPERVRRRHALVFQCRWQHREDGRFRHPHAGSRCGQAPPSCDSRRRPRRTQKIAYERAANRPERGAVLLRNVGLELDRRRRPVREAIREGAGSHLRLQRRVRGQQRHRGAVWCNEGARRRSPVSSRLGAVLHLRRMRGRSGPRRRQANPYRLRHGFLRRLHRGCP
mmetsp:Transcript_52874/g.160686  ORF Transcript_52874/g.160686 Transcript_52874/m.160686 type:complete len:222 (-) Transcript_52874:849-1514(-)